MQKCLLSIDSVGVLLGGLGINLYTADTVILYDRLLPLSIMFDHPVVCKISVLVFALTV